MKTISFLMLCVFFTEILARYGSLFFPFESHQRYGITKSDHYLFEVNGRGAMRQLLDEEPIQIAVFGSSTSFWGVPQDKNWSSLIALKNKGIHVDNFAYFTKDLNSLNENLKSLCRLKRYYNSVIIKISYHNMLEPEDKMALYHHRYKIDSKDLLKSYSFFKSWFYTESNTKSLIKLYEPKTDFEIEEIVQIKKMRQKQKQLFVEHKLSVDSKISSFFIPEIINQAHCLSDKILWLNEPFAYSENMLPEYNDIYYHIESVPYTKNKPYRKFLNNKSLANYMFSQQKAIASILKNYEEVTLIDLQSFIGQEISKQSGLFLDAMHLSKKGHKVVFDFINPILIKELSQ